MTNARLFGNIVERYVKPTFQHEIAKYEIDSQSKETDWYLIDLLNYSLRRSPVPFQFLYISKKSANSGGDVVLDSLCMVDAEYSLETRSINVYFKVGFSKFYFKSYEYFWNQYINDLKQQIQHEMVHYQDFNRLAADLINKAHLGTGYDIGGLAEHPDRKKERIYNDVLRFCNEVNELGFSLVQVFYKYKENPETVKQLVINSSKKYKDHEKFQEFMELFVQLGYAFAQHSYDPSERRAIAQQIIVDFFRKGLNKSDIIDIVKKDNKRTLSILYNRLIGLYGSGDSGLNAIRYEIGRMMLEIINVTKNRKKNNNIKCL